VSPIRTIFRDKSRSGQLRSGSNAPAEPCHRYGPVRSRSDLPPAGRALDRASLPWGLAAICAGMLLAGDASFAANDGSRGAPAVPMKQTGPADQNSADDIEALLRKAEQQIITGHASAPDEDSALETWRHVLEIRRASPDSPKVLTALAGFAGRMRSRAADEKKAGRLVVSGDLTVFADQATKLLGHTDISTSPPPDVRMARSREIPDILSSNGADTLMPGVRSRDFQSFDALSSPLRPPPASRTEPQRIGITMGQTTAAIAEHKVALASPAAGGPNVVVVRPTPASSEPPATTVPAPPSANKTAVQPDPSGTAYFAKRGDELMAIKDITAARKFYEYAANAGSAHAATALAWTFDSDFAAELGVLGLKPDPVMAATWYRRAAELGNPGAAARLRSLLNNEAAAR
jgi:hypothetical protein